MTLGAELRSFDDVELARLLTRRPELLEPRPSNFDELASRAASPYSVQACLVKLSVPLREMLGAISFCNQPTSADDISSLAAQPPEASTVVKWLLEARGLGLIFRTTTDSQFGPGVRVGFTAQGELPKLDDTTTRWSIVPALQRLLPSPFGLQLPIAKLLERFAVSDLATLVANLGIEFDELFTEHRRPVQPTRQNMIKAISTFFSDSENIAAVISHAPLETRDLLSGINESGGLLSTSSDAFPPPEVPDAVKWLTNRSLLCPFAWDALMVPREVTIAMRSGKPVQRFHLEPPQSSSGGEGSVVLRAGVARTTGPVGLEITPLSLLDSVAFVCRRMLAQDITPLRAGGMAVKDVRLMAKELSMDESIVARVIELCGVVGLASSDYVKDRILPTAAFEEWFECGPADRWRTLVRGWSYHAGTLSRVVGPNKAAPLSTNYYSDDGEISRKASILRELLGNGSEQPIEIDSLCERVVWRSPGQWVEIPGESKSHLQSLLDEAGLLGLLVNGRLSEAAIAILGDVEPANPIFAKVFGEVVHAFTVGADLTALAPAELDSKVRARLESCAEVESRGAASMFRFTEVSIRKALDGGDTAESLLEFLTVHAVPSVPQTLRYLIDDVGRKFGAVRIGPALGYLLCKDEALLAEIVSARKNFKLALRLIAPTVAVSTLHPARLIKGLRDAGYFPVLEGLGGEVIRVNDQERAAKAPMWGARQANQAKAIFEEILGGNDAKTGLASFAPRIVSAVGALRH